MNKHESTRCTISAVETAGDARGIAELGLCRLGENVRWRAKHASVYFRLSNARSTVTVRRNLKLRGVPGLGTWTSSGRR